jgi:hypothetical protein
MYTHGRKRLADRGRPRRYQGKPGRDHGNPPELAGVDGVGQTSGNAYVGTGSTKLVNLPSDPCITVDAAFTLETTDGCTSVPLPVTAGLCFDSSWKLLPQSSTVSVGAPS